MATLSINDTRITRVEKDQVYFVGIPIINVIQPIPPYEVGALVREERSHIVSGRVGSYSLATDSPTPYKPGGINGETATLTIQLNYQYREGQITWGEETWIDTIERKIYDEIAGEDYISDEFPRNETDELTYQILYKESEEIEPQPIVELREQQVIDPETDLPVIDEVTGKPKVELVKVTIGTTYVYDVYEVIGVYPWQNDSEGWLEGRDELSFSFYTHPKEFIFNNCESNKQWQVDKGINSLLTNMLEFQGYATQWKYWKIQNDTKTFGNVAIDPCPNWDSPLSANRLTSIYNYLGNSTTYVSGTKISAAMFNNLAALINN